MIHLSISHSHSLPLLLLSTVGNPLPRPSGGPVPTSGSSVYYHPSINLQPSSPNFLTQTPLRKFIIANLTFLPQLLFIYPPPYIATATTPPSETAVLLFFLFFFSSPTTVDKPATDRRLSLILPIPSLRLSALSLSPNSRRRSLLLELARSDDSPPFLPAGSWRWSFSPPAIASASRSTNSGIMTGLIGERGFAPARFST